MRYLKYVFFDKKFTDFFKYETFFVSNINSIKLHVKPLKSITILVQDSNFFFSF